MVNQNDKNLLKKSQYVSVRDKKSFELMKKWKIKHANLVCEPLYSLEIEQPERTKKIGIQLRKFETLTDELFDNIVQQLNRDIIQEKLN